MCTAASDHNISFQFLFPLFFVDNKGSLAFTLQRYNHITSCLNHISQSLMLTLCYIINTQFMTNYCSKSGHSLWVGYPLPNLILLTLVQFEMF